MNLYAQQEQLPDDATIPATDVVYWVGNGSGQVVMAVNWATPDTCLAWGVRFDNDSTLEPPPPTHWKLVDVQHQRFRRAMGVQHTTRW